MAKGRKNLGQLGQDLDAIKNKDRQDYFNNMGKRYGIDNVKQNLKPLTTMTDTEKDAVVAKVEAFLAE